MSKIINKIAKTVSGVIAGSLSQEEIKRSNAEYSVPDYAKELLRNLAAEGIVMLKNDGTLPLENKKISVFGRCQIDYFYCGYGSGGDVNTPYKVNLISALRKCDNISVNNAVSKFYKLWVKKHPVDEGFWGHWPRCFDEPVPDDDLIESASITSDAAVIIIGRAAGEDRDNILKSGSYFLTDTEELLLDKITETFNKTVVIFDCGNIIDLSCLEKYGNRISAVLYAFQGGMESGNAVADVLIGKINPCGKLTDTIAWNYNNYPSSSDFGGFKYNNYTEDIFVGYRYFETFSPKKVLYPFGFGLSYTDFSIETVEYASDAEKIRIVAQVKNTGCREGKEVIQIYCEPPQGKLTSPKRVLCAFGKTKLLAPGESCLIELEFPLYYICSFDDAGVTGFEASYVMQQGLYKFYVSNNVRDGSFAGSYECTNTYCFEKLCHICEIKTPFNTLTAKYLNGKAVTSSEPTAVNRIDLRGRVIKNLPESLPTGLDKGYKLADVKCGKISMEDFVSQLTLKELEALTRGDYTMNSPLGASGNAGALGGVSDTLRVKGVPPVITTDGPAGIRLKRKCSLLPTGACAAASWNAQLIEQVYAFVGKEMLEFGSDILLAPGMNIHRNPLCGRNFEYFSEDPVLSGMCACAVINGVQSNGVSACPKHFACNNQETNRINNDSRVSERALREIYLKGFEIAVKQSKPDCIMTSYNRINGIYSYHNYDLVTTLLRGEWGYNGCVMTDWWTRSDRSSVFPLLHDNSYRVRAQVDVLMPGADSRLPFAKKTPDASLLDCLGEPDGIKVCEIQRSAANVLTLCMKYIR